MVGCDEEVLNRDLLVAFELGIGWQLRRVHLQHFFPIHGDLVHLARFVSCFRLAAFALRGLIGRVVPGGLLVGFDLRLALFTFQPIDFVPQLLHCFTQLAIFGHQLFNQVE